MDVLREWLAPTMIREIGAMMQSRTGASNWSHLPDGNTYSDDGSNLRARSSKSGVVQITKLYATDGPIKVVISDSCTMVRATIASSAATKYGSTMKKQITKDTLGGLIQILEFEIVATHLGARSERATMLINDFKSIGSEGSGAFGCPRPLESLPEVVELLDQLKTSRARETRGSQRSRLGSQTEGSPANSPLDSSSYEASRSIFATQVPSRLSERPFRADDDALQESIKAPTRRKSKGISDENHVTDAQKNQDGLSANAKAKTKGKRNENSAEALLELLAPKQPATRPASKQMITKKFDVAQSLKSEMEPLPTRTEVRISSASDAVINEVGLVATTENLKDTHELGVESKSSTSQTPAAQSLSKPNISPGHTRRDSPPVHMEDVSEMRPESSHSGGVGYREVIQLRKPFKRIRSADIRISKDQQILLDQADSWLPAEPGHRGPVANVPIATLQALNHHAEVAARRSSPLPARQHQEGVDDVTNSIASQPSPGLRDTARDDSDSEIPVSSSEWPPSPLFEQPKDELPPDSSIESIEHPMSGSCKDSSRSNHILQKQIHLETSASSTPARSSQRKPKRTSKALQIAARSSPSLVSGSADEGTKRFKCREPGCNKAYVGVSGLRYHMEHVHNSIQPKGSPSRTRVPKSKNRGKSSVLIYICARCYNHFDTEAEIIHHENLDSCSPPQRGPGRGDVSQSLTNTEYPSTHPLQNDKIIDLREGKQRDGPSSVVWKLGESSPISPGLTYVSPYASPRQTEQVIASFRSSPKSNSGRHGELPPKFSRSSPPLHNAMVPMPDRKWSNGARSDVSSVDSELETTIPHALNEAKDLHVNSAPMQRFPSTATQPEEPFTQVKRTPYINGRLNEKVHSHPGLCALPVNGRMNDVQFIASTKDIERAVPSQPSTPPISAGQRYQVNPGNDHPAQEIKNQKSIDESMVAPQIHAEVAVRSPISRSVSPMRKRNLSHFENIMLRSNSVSTSSELTFHRDDLSVSGARSDSGLKRSSFEPVPLSPHVAKRRKHAKASTAFKFSQDVQVAQDPSILARAYRQEFLASRKSSVSEQSDASRRAVESPGKCSEPTVQHNHKTNVDQDGNPELKLEANHAPAHNGPLQSAPRSTENAPFVTCHSNDQPAIVGNNKDVVMTIEDQGNPGDPGDSLSEAQENVMYGALELLSVHQNTDSDNDVDHSKLWKYQELGLTTESLSMDTKDVLTSKAKGTAPSPLDTNNREVGTELDSNSTGRILREDTDISRQDGQRSIFPFNASLSSGQASDLGTNGGSLTKFSTLALETIERAEGQEEPSTQAPEVANIAEPPEQADVLVANANPQVFGQTVEVISPQKKLVDQPGLTTPVTVFERFKVAYPEYKGNEQRFVAICKKINALFQQDRMEHRSLWDDFIIRHTMEYSQYLQTCAENAEDPLPYERFYRNEIEDPRFTKRIVTPNTLKEILDIGDREDSVISTQQQQQRHLSPQLHGTKSKHVLPQQPPQQHLLQSSRIAGLQSASPTPAFNSPPKPGPIAARSPKLPVPQATVDLTGDNDYEEPIRSPKKMRRSLPWKETTRDDSGSSSHTRGSSKPRGSIPAHPLSTPRGPTSKGLPAFKETRPANPGSKGGAANSSPLPRTSIRLKPQFSPKFGQAAQESSTHVREGVTFSKPLTISDPQDPIALERDSGPDTKNKMGEKTAEAAKPEDDTKKASWKDPDNPFKQFTKAYTSVRPAKGNSFAADKARAEVKDKARENVKNTVREMEKAKVQEKTNAKLDDVKVSSRPRKKVHGDLNILDWHL